jgi:hypothetical protein
MDGSDLRESFTYNTIVLTARSTMPLAVDIANTV